LLLINFSGAHILASPAVSLNSYPLGFAPKHLLSQVTSCGASGNPAVGCPGMVHLWSPGGQPGRDHLEPTRRDSGDEAGDRSARGHEQQSGPGPRRTPRPRRRSATTQPRPTPRHQRSTAAASRDVARRVANPVNNRGHRTGDLADSCPAEAEGRPNGTRDHARRGATMIVTILAPPAGKGRQGTCCRAD
jgi:hypothetical protein